ncbi:IgGFc-binding protein-like [Acanthaster planci]|uniref:IgGFc-binding protein-like n=1 Tax=Acanthaster planci TaxID=133434 RepID=A0A8B7YE72_ACAPL|nr:IgGFc-binding protein-like [Acanthaster planci]
MHCTTGALPGRTPAVPAAMPASYASQCQAIGIEVRPWRTEEFCPLKCPDNSRYSPCMSACPRLCGEDRLDNFVCLLPCVEGCQCEDGHVLDGDQRCVPEDQCGCYFEGLYHTTSEIFLNSNCTMRCTCASGQPVCLPFSCAGNRFCGTVDGVHGCFCNEGFIDNGDICVDDPCDPNPCNNGRCVRDARRASGYYCVCFRGSGGYNCSERSQGHCYAHGDPHYRSLDGVNFNYQGGCKYVLLQPCDPGNGPAFRVIQENQKVRESGQGPSRTRAVYVEIDGTVFAFKRNRKLYVNGVEAKPPVVGFGGLQVIRRGKYLVMETPFGLEVRWNGRYDVDISLSSDYFNNTCGLCGNWNGNTEDEFGEFETPEAFGNSWAVEGQDCESDEEPTPFVCHPNPVVLVLVQEVCSIVYSDTFSSCSSLGLADSFYESCVFDLCTTYPEFPNFCPSVSFYADVCQESGLPVGIWRSPQVCPLECPEHSHYSRCMSACPARCPNGTAEFCPFPCVEGCECNDGYLLSGDECVRQEECGCSGRFYLEPGDSYVNDNCTMLCTCDGPGTVSCVAQSCHENATCGVRDGQHGCYCNEGYYGDGYECQQDPCYTGEEHCSDNGECVSDGDGNFHCACRRGWSGEDCSTGMAICSGHGDPHYTSFDGRRFNYQGKCRYIVFRSTLKDEEIPFEVVAQHRPARRNRRVALTEELHIIAGDARIELLQDREVRINGVEFNTPVYPFEGVSIKRVGKQLVLQTDFDVKLEWDGTNAFSIEVSPDYLNRTWGLCGTYDEDPDNDFTTPGGRVVEDENSFGNSWVYGHDCNETEPPGDSYNPCEENSDSVNLATQLCRIITQENGPFRECHDDINPQGYYESCLYDLCSTLPDRGALCEDVAKYADDCLWAGVEIEEWRREDFCSFRCPAGSSYRLCAPGCPMTCRDMRDSGRSNSTGCTQPCREGCQCEEGTVLSGERCVPPDQCGCYHGGAYFMQGEHFLTADCKMGCVCNDSEVQCAPIACHENAECILEDGERRCRCQEPLIGDGIEECNLNPCTFDPCENFGVCHPVGSDDYWCECTEFWTGKSCELRRGVCLSYGTQHFVTFDGASLTFEGECHYVLAKTCPDDVEPSFQVIQESTRLTPLSSGIEAIHVLIDDKKITLGRRRSVEVNGLEVELPVSEDGIEVRISGMNVVLRSPIGLEVAFDGWHAASVIVPSNFTGRLCGLCGNFDGSYANDSFIRGKPALETDVGNFYRVNDDCAVPIEPPPTVSPCDSVSPQALSEAYAFCNEVVEGPLSRCVDMPQVFKARCLFDACASRLNPYLICLHPLTVTRHCRRFGVRHEPWRSLDYCPVDCPEGSHYNPSASPCPETCVDVRRNQRPRCEHERRVEACECDDGYVLSGPHCVPRDDCGCYQVQTGNYYEEGQVFMNEECSSLCTCQSGSLNCVPVSCDENAECTVSDGRRRCECNDGYLGNGMECQASPCTEVDCLNNGTCIPGPNGTYGCLCQWDFAGDYCEQEVKHCIVYGVPHYTTFSLVSYAFQGAGQYYLTRACNESAMPYFEVIQQTERILQNPRFTITEAILIHFQDVEIGLHGNYRLTVNEREILPPYRQGDLFEISMMNNRVIVTTNFNLTVEWDGFHSSIVTLSTDWASEICGLCGDMGGPVDGEIAAHLSRPGSIAAFGDRNIANPGDCPPATKPNIIPDCSDEESEQIRPFCLPLVNERGPFRRCPRELGTVAASACLDDSCALGHDVVTPICQSFSILTKLCQRLGIEVDRWRVDGFCPVTCPEHSEYKVCANACQRRCGGPVRLPAECPFNCEEGCECEDGYVLDHDSRCVRPNDCGCMDQGYYHLNEEEYYRDGCQEICQCVRGEPVCKPVACHHNATCGVHDGDYGCYCNDGYHGNGTECREDPCYPNPCENDGICTIQRGEGPPYQCSCVGHWRGDHCNQGVKSCSVSGHTHYDRFDGQPFDFYGGCKYVLARPCAEGDNSFRVILQNAPDDEFPALSRIEAVHISIGDQTVTLKQGMEFEVNGEEQHYPFNQTGIHINQYGWIVRVTTDLGLTVSWNGRDLVDVTLPSDFAQSTCGICGDITNPMEGFGEYENAREYAMASVLDSQDCQPPRERFEPCEEHTCNLQEAVEKCALLLSPKVACPPGWFSPPGERNVHVCYYVRRPEEPLTYAAAYHECASKGGRLYDPATELEALSFRNATAERHDGSYWLGCSDAEEEGSWSCHRDDHSWSNESQSGYWSWDEDQPDDGGTLLLHEDCAMVFDHEHWRDVSCHAQATLLVCQLDSPREYLTPFKKCHEVVPPYPYFIGCIQSQCATLPDDNRLCSSITAYANVCRLYGAHVGLWQSRNFCRPECPEGSFWSDCVSPCPPTCANPDRACPLPCRPGCECRQGWVRQGHRCVPREQCGCFMEGMGRFIEPGDGVFKPDCAELCHCRPGGELDCQEVNCTDHASCVANERSGDLTCQCEDGYAFMNNECQPDACTGVECANGGTCIARHGMYSCFCQIGWTGQHCEDEEAWCQVLGFSHYYTFDGTSYNFFGDCIYHLAGHCGEDVKKPLFWILEKKERHVLRREVASLYFVEVHIDDWVFTLKRDHVVLVNGVRWNLPVTSFEGVRIEWIGNRVVLHTAFGLQVFWDGHSDVAIRLPGEFKNQTCGLCSSYDGNQTNDLVPKEGDQVQSPAEFGNSWLQNDEDCRPDEGNISPVFFVQDCAEIGQINSFCANLFQSFSESCSGPYLEYYFILCIADSCLLRNPRYGCHYAAEAVAECKAQGGRPTPRDMLPEPCGVECPPNSEFSFCASPCPRTCDDVRGHDRTPCEGIPCVEGCRCKEGFVLSGVHCVPEEECGCRDRFLYGGAYYLDGQEFVSHGCREKCECDGGTFRCRPLECHCQSECTADDYGQYGCHCEHPYVGNGSICTVDPCYSNPCVNGGKCEVTGNFSYVCVCQPVWTGMNCERARKECSVYGSPQHFRTFDGANYNFFGTCWYTLAADCSEEPLFRVYIRSEQVVGRQELTKVQEVVVQSGHDGPKFGLHQHKKLTVEGRPVNTPFAHEGIHVVSGTHMLLTTPYGLTVRWNGYFEVDVWLDTKLLANVSLCGLCGNADGNADNILEETPDGRRVSNSVEFGNSWVVNPEECEDRGSDVENACNGDIELAAARSTCAIIVDENGPFAQCGKELDSMLFYDNCVFSLCASGNPDNRSLICGSLWTFESACLDLCLDVGPWRAPGFCEPPCSDGQVFEPSTPACPKTCLGVILEASLPCPFPHQAGCTCAPHLFLSNDECVPKDHCGCFYEGQYRKASEVFISHECESVCTCHPGNRVECRERGCPKGAFCGVKEEKYGCHCKPGYEDDGCGGCRANACHPDQCKNNGTCVIIGKDDYLCRCPAGYGGKNCESVLARCTVSGDPHVETFDGVRYRFGSECEHVLVHNVFEQDVPQFFVTLVTERSDTNPNVTSIKMIRILSTSQENGYYLEIRQGLILLINGVRVIPPLILPWSQIHLSGSWLVLIDHTLDLVLRWDGYNHLDVFVHSKLGEVCGLCGFYDGNNSNDFLKQTGEFTSDAVDFANSWFVINSTCEAAVELPNQCGGDSTLMVAADNACNAIRDTVGSLASCHKVIPFQPFYDKCVFDVCKSLPDTSARCSHIQDYAQRCINAGVDVGYQWRTERNCFSECPEHSHFSPCIGSCPPSCLGELLYQDPRQCFPYCNDGCECDEGYYLSDDRCVPKEECGCLLPSEISQLTVVPVGFTFMFDNCGILCSCGADGDLICSNATCHSDGQCLIIDGVEQCVCNDSLIGNGLECNTSPCEAKPCQNGGTCIVEENLSYSCVCQRGWTGTNCMQETLYCLTYGDPHYRTFDGKYFDFMGECSYYLFRLCEADSTTSVIQVNQRVGSSAYTTMKELIINYGGTEIKLVPDVGVVVSDVVQTPPFNATPVVEIRRVGNYIVVKIPDQFDLKWDGQYSADIELTAVIGSTQFCGLCGNANNNTDDDFDDGNEQTVDTAVSFGNRQVVGNLPCPANATEQPNQCDNAFDTEFADTVCSPLLDSRDNFPFQGCSASSAEFYAACRYDVCAAVLVDPSLALPIACGVVATYAQLCQDLGHAVSEWRSAISCTQDCPRNAEYSLCADPCPATCRDPDGDISPCNLRCAEGCTCREGFYQDGDECVPRSQCGCQYDNEQKYLRLNDDYYTNSCTMRCTCSDAFGEVVCSPAACHENATCTEVNGIQKCVCDEGFVGNGQDCVFEECADSPCAEGSQCLRRMGGSPNYVCECADNNRMGQNCDVQAEYDARYACYGADCASTWFKSPNYSQPYPNSWKGFYQLWVPGARYINVTFPEAFQVETGRDYLYLGPGFQYPLGLNQGPLSTLQGVIYRLDGYTSPGPVYIEGDAVWMYFVTDDQVNAHGWHAMLEAEFVDLPDTPVCWDGSETRPSGSTWEYGKCDECNCAAGAVIKCSLNASKPISCTEDSHCPASSTCVPSDQVPLCVTEPCSGMYCDVGTIHADCAENPFCSEVTVSAELASIIPSTTLTQLCDSLIAAAEIVSVADCFTFECSIRREARKKRAASDDTVLVDIFLESGSPSTGSAAPVSEDGMTPADALALSVYEGLSLHISDPSLPVNITSVVYLGPRPATKEPPTDSTLRVTIKKVTTGPVEANLSASSVTIVAVGSSMMILLVALVLTIWCRRRGRQSSKKTMTFQTGSEEAHTNEVFEMVDPGPAFSRAIPLDDGTGHQGNVYGVKYDLDS